MNYNYKNFICQVTGTMTMTGAHFCHVCEIRGYQLADERLTNSHLSGCFN